MKKKYDVGSKAREWAKHLRRDGKQRANRSSRRRSKRRDREEGA